MAGKARLCEYYSLRSCCAQPLLSVEKERPREGTGPSHRPCTWCFPHYLVYCGHNLCEFGVVIPVYGGVGGG